MIKNKQKIDKNILVNNLYKENRKTIIRTINMINTSLENSSQTFFLALYYMDLIFINPNFEETFKSYFENNENDLKIEINKKDLYMICLACLIIATKYNENDPHVPNIISFINLLSYYSRDMYKYQLDDIRKAEVFVLKAIEYKLNYFSIYHYFSFFFTHGFLFNKIFEKEKIREQRMNKDEILEKIYIKSREIMNIFIQDDDNINFILGTDNYFTSIQILIWSTETILNIPFIDLFEEEKNIFELLYKIDYDKNKENNDIIKNKIQKIYDNIQIREKNKVQEFDINNNKIDNNILMNSYDKSKNLYEEICSKSHNLNIISNNLFISSDNYYLNKYRINNNNFLNRNRNYQNDNKERVVKKNNHTFIITKNKYNNNNIVVSKSTKNYKYKQLFQFGCGMKNNKFNYSSSKKKILEIKKEQNEENEKRLINIEDNFKQTFNKNNSLAIINNNKDSFNHFRKNNNSIYLNYRYGDYNKNSKINKDLNKSNEIDNEQALKNDNNDNITFNENNNNNINNNIVSKTKMILDNINYPSSTSNKKSQNNINNKHFNYYYNKLYDNSNNYIMNDRYSVKENIQNNFLHNSTNFNKIKNNKNNSYINEKGNINLLYSYNKNEINQPNNNNSYSTFYHYGKSNQYENIDKFCRNSNYYPRYFKNYNNYYY